MTGPMVGRKVLARGRPGTVVHWDPYGAGMCDALVEFEDGYQCRYASYELKPDPAHSNKPLPSREAACAANEALMKVQLEGIQARLMKDHNSWSGAEFGKVIVSQALEGALGDLGQKNRK